MLKVRHAHMMGDVHAACFSHVVSALCNAVKDYPDAEGTICIGAHSVPMIPSGWIVWNFEQVTADSPWMTERYLWICRNHEVWDYSPANIAAWKQIYGVEAKLLPLGYDPAMTGAVGRCIAKLDKPRFYGALNDRRNKILNRTDHLKLTVPCYGQALDRELSAAPCVLNVHYYESAVFEIVRCSYLFANAVPVMSEDSADMGDYSHIPGLFPGDDLARRANSREYPSGEAQRRAYMGSPWLAENLAKIL